MTSKKSFVPSTVLSTGKKKKKKGQNVEAQCCSRRSTCVLARGENPGGLAVKQGSKARLRPADCLRRAPFLPHF